MITTNQIADAVTASVNEPGAGYSQTFVAVRSCLPEYEHTDSNLHVTVVPKGVVSEISTRVMVRNDHQVDIGVMKKLSDATNASVDPYVTLLEEIQASLLRKSVMVGQTAMTCVKAEVVPLYSPEILREARRYIGVLTLTYRVLEA